MLETFTPEDYLILKLDIEGAEYDVLERLTDANLLGWLNELYVEYHWWGTVSIRDPLRHPSLRSRDFITRNDWP